MAENTPRRSAKYQVPKQVFRVFLLVCGFQTGKVFVSSNIGHQRDLFASAIDDVKTTLWLRVTRLTG